MFKLTEKGLCMLITIFLVFFFCANEDFSHASGFSILNHGTKELGLMNSTIAHTEGPASNVFNPALLCEIPGTQIETALTVVCPKTKFKNEQTGVSSATKDSFFWLPELFISHKLNSKIAIGLGVYSPFGLGTHWPDDWEGRYMATESDMFSMNVNPNLAWKITDYFTIAGGIDYYPTKATMKSKINLSSFGLPDADRRLKGRGDGWGYNLGLLFRFGEKYSFGASYRSKVDLRMKGDMLIDLPPNSPAALREIFPEKTGLEATIKMAEQVFAGFAIKPDDKWTIEIGGAWEGWSRNDEITFYFDQPIAGNTVVHDRAEWHDTYVVNFGIKYNISPTLAISFGYLHSTNPGPDNTFEPGTVPADYNEFAIGLQKQAKIKDWNISWALAYAYEITEERTKNNDIGADSGLTANGRYRTKMHILSAAVTITF